MRIFLLGLAGAWWTVTAVGPAAKSVVTRIGCFSMDAKQLDDKFKTALAPTLARICVAEAPTLARGDFYLVFEHDARGTKIEQAATVREDITPLITPVERPKTNIKRYHGEGIVALENSPLISSKITADFDPQNKAKGTEARLNVQIDTGAGQYSSGWVELSPPR